MASTSTHSYSGCDVTSLGVTPLAAAIAYTISVVRSPLPSMSYGRWDACVHRSESCGADPAGKPPSASIIALVSCVGFLIGIEGRTDPFQGPQNLGGVLTGSNRLVRLVERNDILFDQLGDVGVVE